MFLYLLEPEVAGGHGEQTLYGIEENSTKNGISGKIKYLHYEFDGWLGDDLLESTPAFIVSRSLANELNKNEIKDYKLEKCLITLSDVCMELNPNIEITSFTRFIPLGTVEVHGEYFENWSGHHFCLSSKGELVVSKSALDLLKKFSINQCEITRLTKS